MFVDQIEYKEEWYDGSFTARDLDDVFYKKAIAAYYSRSSGLGGPGTLRILTDENEQYVIGMDMMRDDEFLGGPGYEFYRVSEQIPLFAIAEKDKNDDLMRPRFQVESDGWTCQQVFSGYYLIRDDYLEIDKQAGKPYIDSEDGTHREILYPFGKIGSYLKAQGKEPKTYIYEGTKQYRIYMMEEWEKYEAECERVRIRNEDVEWRPIYPNNQYVEITGDPDMDRRGEYLLVFRENKTYGVIGEKWSVIPQWKDRCISKDSEITSYNLFCKEYEQIEGPLGYADPHIEASDYEILHPWPHTTFRHSDINDEGEFIYAFRTKEEAKAEAMRSLNGNLARGGYNRENLITDYPSKEVEEEIIFNKYGPLVYFVENFDRVSKIMREFEFGKTRGGDGWIISRLTNELQVSDAFAYNLKNIRLRDLNVDNVEYAKKRLAEIGRDVKN